MWYRYIDQKWRSAAVVVGFIKIFATLTFKQLYAGEVECVNFYFNHVFNLSLEGIAFVPNHISTTGDRSFSVLLVFYLRQ